MVTALMLNDDGTELVKAPVPEPGGEVRFGVGSPDDARTGTFRLWAPDDKSDVYIANRQIAGTQKVSFHQTPEG